MLTRTDRELLGAFYELKTRKDISDMLEIEDKSLRYFLYGKPLYKSFEIPKRNGEKRTIIAPENGLKSTQKKLAYILNLVYKPKECTCGFVKRKSIVDNAQKHIKKKLILNIDLKDFFTQINFGRVRGIFLSKPYSLEEEAATTLAQIVCYKGFLPQGAPTSPIISNMVCRSLDNALMRLAKKYHVTYSRYADDLTFSTFSSSLPNAIARVENNTVKIGPDLQSILDKNSFSVNEEKTSLMTPIVHQDVTGLTVNKKINVNRKYIKTLRAILHNINKNSIYNEAIKYLHSNYCRNKSMIKHEDNIELIEKWFRKVVIGKINFIKQIRGEYDLLFITFAKQANIAFKDELFSIKEQDDIMKKADNSVFVIESENNQGSCFYLDGYGIITSAHVIEDRCFYSVYKYTNAERFDFLPYCEEDMFISEELDYAVFRKTKDQYKNCFTMAKSLQINIGDKVKTIGYPDYVKSDTPSIQNAEVISKTQHFGAVLYTISGKLGHGSSGGVVLNKNDEVIGIIKSGVSTANLESDEGKHGFLPISIMIEDIKKRYST